MLQHVDSVSIYQKAKKNRKLLFLCYLLLTFFLLTGLVLSFVFMNRGNRIPLEISASFLAFFLLSGSFAFWSAYFIPLQKEIRFFSLSRKQTPTKENLLSVCISEERSKRSGVSFFVWNGTLTEGQKTYFLAPQFARALKGKKIVSFESVDSIVVGATFDE